MFMKIVPILIKKILPVNSEVLVHLKNIENPDNPLKIKQLIPYVIFTYFYFQEPRL